MQTGMGDKMIKLPEKVIELNQFGATSLHNSMKEAFRVRKNNKVPTQVIEGKCAWYLLLTLQTQDMCRLIGVRNERF